jgi:hypothetical protein
MQSRNLKNEKRLDQELWRKKKERITSSSEKLCVHRKNSFNNKNFAQ